MCPCPRPVGIRNPGAGSRCGQDSRKGFRHGCRTPHRGWVPGQVPPKGASNAHNSRMNIFLAHCIYNSWCGGQSSPRSHSLRDRRCKPGQSTTTWCYQSPFQSWDPPAQGRCLSSSCKLLQVEDPLRLARWEARPPHHGRGHWTRRPGEGSGPCWPDCCLLQSWHWYLTVFKDENKWTNSLFILWRLSESLWYGVGTMSSFYSRRRLIRQIIMGKCLSFLLFVWQLLLLFGLQADWKVQEFWICIRANNLETIMVAGNILKP